MSHTQSPSNEAGELRFGLSLVVAICIGGLFLYLAARVVPIDAVAEYLSSVDWWMMAPAMATFMAVYTVCHAARIIRWYFLVRPLGRVDAPEVFRVGTVGFTAILLLPLRLGELVRPFLLARRAEVSGAGVLATIVVERVLDGLIITGLLFVGLWLYQGDASTELVRSVGLVAAAIFVPALLLCIVAAHNRRTAQRLVMATVGRVSKKIGHWLAELFGQFADGFGALSRRDDLIPFLALTAVYWSMNALSMWLLLHIGFDMEVTVGEMVTVMAVLVVGIMVPAGPALAGNFEYFMVQGLSLYVPVDAMEVAGQTGAFAALVHLLQIVVIVLPGVWIMIRHRTLRLNRETVRASQAMDDDKTSDAQAELTSHCDDP